MMKTVKIDLKVCGVCGDKALGYNFNAITCESCKAFFRRNAVIQKPLKCPFSNRCDITTLTRRFCQKCRLDKCFSIGMCKDLIMSEQDKVAKRQKIEENRVKRQNMGNIKTNFKKIKREYVESDSLQESQSNTDSDSNYTNADQASPRQPSPQHTSPPNIYDYTNISLDSTESSISSPADRYISSNDDRSAGMKGDHESSYFNKNIENDSHCGSNLNINSKNNNTSRYSSCNNDVNRSSNSDNTENCDLMPSVDIFQVMNDVQSVRSEDSSPIESILCEAIKLEFQAFSSISHNPSNSRELNDAERAKLNELIVANKAFLIPIDEEFENLVGRTNFENSQQKMDATVLVDVINLTTIYVRRLIKMVKKIGAFRNMCQEDQVALLKGGCTEVMMLRSAMNYDTKIQSWQIPHSTENFRVNSKILKLINKGTAYNEHEKFIKTFGPLWKGDENIILILCMILVFSPDRPKVVHQDVIRLEQNAYFYLLRRYLESIHSGCEAKSLFLKLMQKLTEVRRVNEELISVYLNINPSEVEPLLIEIFDLHR
ncbi:nuclear hormone receptor HR96 isoform X2 [Diorhabda sublineata]|uniref:nuclear hormone receptor HR96 isoform X2 n=1 Tax=Diorhabda sublineata TaxID=1163346 RepID=UPI0024E181DE|nr:nuclear hormone receptor HR96 isoform X2 [Diorhabda sublineata]